MPIAVFLGMTCCSPIRPPRPAPVGRIFYGVLYGLTTVLLYDWLLSANTPGFYDKLLQVPLLNLSVNLLDQLARSPNLKAINPPPWCALGAAPPTPRVHGRVGGAFFAMSASGHPATSIPDNGCRTGGRCARPTSATPAEPVFLHDGYCPDGSVVGVQRARHPVGRALTKSQVAAAAFDRACTLRFAAGCDNTVAMTRAGMFRHDTPTAGDYRFILRGSKGPIQDRAPAQLYARACEQGWPNACGSR